MSLTFTPYKQPPKGEFAHVWAPQESPMNMRIFENEPITVYTYSEHVLYDGARFGAPPCSSSALAMLAQNRNPAKSTLTSFSLLGNSMEMLQGLDSAISLG